MAWPGGQVERTRSSKPPTERMFENGLGQSWRQGQHQGIRLAGEILTSLKFNCFWILDHFISENVSLRLCLCLSLHCHLFRVQFFSVFQSASQGTWIFYNSNTPGIVGLHRSAPVQTENHHLTSDKLRDAGLIRPGFRSFGAHWTYILQNGNEQSYMQTQMWPVRIDLQTNQSINP